jgi:hypothetical protein
MAITEQRRHDLYVRLEAALGPQEATTLMEHLPPVGWADVATKADLAAMEERLEARLELRFSSALGDFKDTMHRDLMSFQRQLIFVLVGMVATIVITLVTSVLAA